MRQIDSGPCVPVNKIRSNPYQPRVTYDENELIHLCESIAGYDGLVQPTVARIGRASLRSRPEEGFVKKVRVRMKTLEGLPLEEMARILVGAGYLVQAPV